MREDFLHFLWRTKRFDLGNLLSTTGEPIEIQHFGEANSGEGPDFLQAKIYIGDTLWAGNVEMHLKSSEWYEHGHQNNRHYDNVILHVVLEEDQPVFRENGERLPCLTLQNRIPAKLVNTYHHLIQNEFWIPCQHHFYAVPEMTKSLWLDRLLVERLEEKTAAIERLLAQNQNHWEETFYQVLARNFGVKVNAEPFEMLARAMPLLTLSKHRNDHFQIEALLFGQAGLLEKEFEDEYPGSLKQEYQYLQKKYNLSPIPAVAWKFLRLRPAGFPTIRIAQLAALIFQSVHLFDKILHAQTITEVEQHFQVEVSEYWLSHFVFDKPAPASEKTIGKTTFHLIIINTIAPFLFLYGKMHADDSCKDKAIRLLEDTPPEQNVVIENWKKLGMSPQSAYQTQALLQLKNSHCARQDCLKCAIGSAILK